MGDIGVVIRRMRRKVDEVIPEANRVVAIHSGLSGDPHLAIMFSSESDLDRFLEEVKRLSGLEDVVEKLREENLVLKEELEITSSDHVRVEGL